MSKRIAFVLIVLVLLGAVFVATGNLALMDAADNKGQDKDKKSVTDLFGDEDDEEEDGDEEEGDQHSSRAASVEPREPVAPREPVQSREPTIRP